MIEDKGHQERPISRTANKKWRDNYDDIFNKKDKDDEARNTNDSQRPRGTPD